MKDEHKHKIAKSIYNGCQFLNLNKWIILKCIISALVCGFALMYLIAIVGLSASLDGVYFFWGVIIGILIPLYKPMYKWVMKWKEPIN